MGVCVAYIKKKFVIFRTNLAVWIHNNITVNITEIHSGITDLGFFFQHPVKLSASSPASYALGAGKSPNIFQHRALSSQPRQCPEINEYCRLVQHMAPFLPSVSHAVFGRMLQVICGVFALGCCDPSQLRVLVALAGTWLFCLAQRCKRGQVLTWRSKYLELLEWKAVWNSNHYNINSL